LKKNKKKKPYKPLKKKKKKKTAKFSNEACNGHLRGMISDSAHCEATKLGNMVNAGKPSLIKGISLLIKGC